MEPDRAFWQGGTPMEPLDRLTRNRNEAILTRADLLAAGGTDRMIASRLDRGIWNKVHAGVYVWGPKLQRWLDRLEAAVAAAGPHALVSHRAAFVLWDLEGLDTRLVEITVPYRCAPTPDGVIRHRTRRPMPREIVAGLPVTSVERTLLDVAAVVPSLVVRKGIDSALRRDMTTAQRLWGIASTQGGRGVPGSGRFRTALDAITDTGATGSAAEVEILSSMIRAGIPRPVLQWEVATPSGRIYLVDFGWPARAKGVEIDGLEAHGGADKLDRDLIRQNDLMDAGVELRRFSARTVRRQPRHVIESIRRFLES